MSKLPTRSTRGRRFRRVIEEEVEADEEFWNQDFFREEARDSDYESETEEDDVVDADFSDKESVSGDSSVEEEPRERPKRKRMVPPGSEVTCVRPAGRQGKVNKVEEAKSSEVTLRASTLRRRSEAERERLQIEQQREKRRLGNGKERVKPVNSTSLEEFLREAAEMEIINLASLYELEIVEEESKKRAMQTKSVYNGPSIKTRSRMIEGVEKSVLELRNIHQVPARLRRKSKPSEPSEQFCVITGLPAKYRDPVTKLPYATIEAFHEIRRSLSIGKLCNDERSH